MRDVDTVDIDGQRFEYEMIGDGEPVVAMRNVAAPVHAWPTPGETTAMVEAGLSLVSYRHLGTTDTIEGIAADVGRLLDHLGLASVALWGWSQGAMAAQELALARPDIVRGAVMMATRCRLSAYDRVRYAVEDELTGDSAALWTLVQNLSPTALPDDEVFERAWGSMRGSSDPAQAALTARASRAGASYADRGDALRALRVPCMVVAFGDDVNIPPPLNREVADAIPGCTYVEIAGAGHSGGITHRREVRGHVLPFLLDVSRPRP